LALSIFTQSLTDQVQRYARLHRQTISDLIRDGLEWRITDGDPYADLASDRYTSVPEEFLSDRNESPLDTLLAETDRPALDALLSDTKHNVLDEIMSDMNGIKLSSNALLINELHVSRCDRGAGRRMGSAFDSAG